MLKGQAKTDYQRRYMQERRAEWAKLRLEGTIVRPPVRPRIDADGEIIPEMEG